MRFAEDKIKSLMGFAVKAGKVLYGTDNIVETKRKKYLIAVCRTISDRSLKRITETCAIPVIRCKYADLGEILHKDNCKAVALLDRQMAEAAINSINYDLYDLVSEGK